MYAYYLLFINPGLYFYFIKEIKKREMCCSSPKSSPALPVDFAFSLQCLIAQTPAEALGPRCPVGGHLVWPTQPSQEISMQLTALMPTTFS